MKALSSEIESSKEGLYSSNASKAHHQVKSKQPINAALEHSVVELLFWPTKCRRCRETPALDKEGPAQENSHAEEVAKCNSVTATADRTRRTLRGSRSHEQINKHKEKQH